VLWLRRYERISIKIGDFEGTGSVWTKIASIRGRPPTMFPVRKLDKWMYYTVQQIISFCHNAYTWQKTAKPCICIHSHIVHKKLIRRWDSERELCLRRHRARTAKHNRLVHIFCHRSTRLCVGTHVFTKFSEITQYNGHYAVQGHSRSPMLLPIESLYTTSY